DEEPDTSARRLSFQRVSDDEEASAAQAQEAQTSEPPEPETVKEKPTAAERRKRKTGVIGRLFKSKKAEDEAEAETAATAETPSADAFDTFPDSEASITTGRPHEEFATRRGGRRRRRPAKRTPDGAETNGASAANGHDEDVEIVEVEAQAPEMIEEQPVALEEP